ncbi:MAG: DUF6716 putative glycosyltransferase [Curtobacterium sp.]
MTQTSGSPTIGLEARHTSATTTRLRRVVGLVDTDSFAKWGAHLLAAAPEHWDLELVVVRTPRTASTAQLGAAFRGLDRRLAALASRPPAPTDVDAIIDRLRTDPPDAVLVSLIGPVAELVIDQVHRRVPDRPVLLTGLPGISFPAKWKGLFFRARADLFVLHSHREVRAYEELAVCGGLVPAFALATLPFARPTAERSARTEGTTTARDSVVFAAQPSVPADPVDRRRIVQWLAATAATHPEWRVVIKVRATAGEQQTHREQYPYADLIPQDAPANLVVETGPMAEHLERAVALVTVSSTAVLEAVSAGVPALTLTDFGVAPHLINEVFVGSGLPGDASDLVAGRFRTVRPEWMRDNHFHPASDDDWAAQAEELMRRRDAGALQDRPAARRSRGGALRRAWERKTALGRDDRSALGVVALVIGTPVRGTKQLARKVIRASRPGRSDGLERLRDRDQQLVARRDAG